MAAVATPDRTAAERQRRHRAQRRNRAELALVRQDWALFVQPDRLAQKAGCAMRHLRRMAVKELADNAADASGEVTVEQRDENTVRVADRGPGLDRDRVLELFAIDRPMTSSKLLRRPTRGAIGNGLRVVTGAVLGSGGTLTVESRGRSFRVEVDRATGATRIAAENASEVTVGTAVTACFGPGLPADPDVLAWARVAAALAGPAARPLRSHPSWYDEAAWRELVEAAAGHVAADLLDYGFGIATEDERPAGRLTLWEAQDLAAAVPEPRLVPIPTAAFDGAHAQVPARLHGMPVLVQAWATAHRLAPRANGSLAIELVLNRTTGPARLVGYFDERRPVIQGCQLNYTFDGKPAAYRATLAVTAPYVPMVTDGKEPDLDPFADPICEALAAAMRKAHAKARRPAADGTTIVEAAFEVMADAYRKASADGTLPANARQVYYAARPAILALTGKGQLDSNYFTQTLLPRYLDENPEETAGWDVVYDARGHLTEPHTGRIVALGTLDVRGYLAPREAAPGEGLVRLRDGPWQGATTDRYRTALFIEKEGFEPLIAAARIRERFDVAVLSTKGMSTTAARALLERLSRDGVRILVAHDLDRAGKSILGTLAGDTRRYRYEVAPNVIDLGLTLAQGRALDLQEEENPIAKGTDRGRLRTTLTSHGATREEIEFLVDQERRIELNAMTSDVFIAWLEARLAEHGAGKVVPDATVLAAAWRRARARQDVAAAVRAAEAEALAAADAARVPTDLAARVRAIIEGTASSWDVAVDHLVSRSGSDD
jgi:hypothetical protein